MAPIKWKERQYKIHKLFTFCMAGSIAAVEGPLATWDLTILMPVPFELVCVRCHEGIEAVTGGTGN